MATVRLNQVKDRRGTIANVDGQLAGDCVQVFEECSSSSSQPLSNGWLPPSTLPGCRFPHLMDPLGGCDNLPHQRSVTNRVAWHPTNQALGAVLGCGADAFLLAQTLEKAAP
jgi:hypothetical protein